MAVNGEDSFSTQGGGLFDENAYQLFKKVEIDFRDKLVNWLQPSLPPGDTKAEMIASVLSNDSLEFYWSGCAT